MEHMARRDAFLHATVIAVSAHQIWKHEALKILVKYKYKYKYTC